MQVRGLGLEGTNFYLEDEPPVQDNNNPRDISPAG
jgi:hypothetical protein